MNWAWQSELEALSEMPFYLLTKARVKRVPVSWAQPGDQFVARGNDRVALASVCLPTRSNALRASMSLGRSAELRMGQVYASAPTFTTPTSVAWCEPVGASLCLRVASTAEFEIA